LKRNGGENSVRFGTASKKSSHSGIDPEEDVRDQVLVPERNRGAERERRRSNVAHVPTRYLLE
jgi:hypothetical protein